MRKPTREQQQLLKRLMLAGCATDTPVVAPSCPFLIKSEKNPPEGEVFLTTSGTGVVVRLEITATESINVAGYEITLDVSGQTAKPVPYCNEHHAYCLHGQASSENFDSVYAINRKIGHLGRLKYDTVISGPLIAEFPAEVSLDLDVEHKAKLWICDYRGDQYWFPLRLVRSARVLKLPDPAQRSLESSQTRNDEESPTSALLAEVI